MPLVDASPTLRRADADLLLRSAAKALWSAVNRRSFYALYRDGALEAGLIFESLGDEVRTGEALYIADHLELRIADATED